ncbi:MAG: AAA family ATPase [Candidatus Omnitrophica bacterium]|nr:AAA family ATPase [Candidatus Omnitrophota bacterium]
MYQEFFGFKEKPFNVTPDPRFIYFSDQHIEALNHVLYGIRERKGFIAIIGEVGAGKTTLCRTLLSRLDNQTTKTAYIFNPDLSGQQLIRTILEDLGLDATGRTKKDLLDTLNAFLMEQLAQNHNVVVIIDEAQGLGKRELEEVRLLSNLETETDKLLQIVLVGQPELAAILDDPEIRQLKQRIAVRYHLDPLHKSEVRKYIDHRMSVAGCMEPPHFTEGALEVISKFSKGVPRMINLACDRTLLNAFVWETREISEAIAQRAVDEIEGKKFPSLLGMEKLTLEHY